MDNFKLTPSCFRNILPKIESNKKYIDNVDINKYNSGFPLNKYWTFDFIEKIADYIDFDTIKIILDIGSRDGHQSVEFRNWFPNAKIVAFEANLAQIDECLTVTHGYNVDVIAKAVGDYNGKTSFHVCDNNVGGSSLLKISGHPRSAPWKQNEIEVDTIRIDDWAKENNITTIDLLWVDVQGAEKLVFEGCGDIINDVKAICTEVELSHMYSNSILKDELDKYLETKGFVAIQSYHMGDLIKSFDELVNNIAECDVIYINKKYL